MREIIDNYLEDTAATFRNYKKMAEKALRRVSDEEFFEEMDGESNSVAIIVKHISGNLRSRFTDFLTTDGEKPDRDRDTEFVVLSETRVSLMKDWENGWEILFETLDSLSASDFGRKVEIRGEPHSVIEALNRQLTHYAYHIGQIVFIAKHMRVEEWKTLSVPRNKSAEFNKFLEEKRRDGKVKSHPLEGPSGFSDTN